MPRRRRWLLVLATSSLVGLLVLWLALPRLAGFALSHWLELPGVSGLAVRFDSIGWQQIRIASLQFRYQTATGDQLDVDANQLTLDLNVAESRATFIGISELTLQLQLSEAAAPTPWPTLALPRLPVDRLTITQLRVQWPQQDIAVLIDAPIQLAQDNSRAVTLTMSDHDRHISARLADADQQLILNATASHQGQPVFQAELRSNANPGTQPVQWQVAADVAALRSWPALVPAGLNLPDSSGTLRFDGSISLGPNSGEWQRLDGALQLQDLQLHTEQALLALTGQAQLQLAAASSAGSKTVPEQAELQWQPGTTFAVQMADRALGSGNATLTEPFNLRWQAGGGPLLRGQLDSSGAVRLHWNAARYGDWQFDLKSLSISDHAAAALQVTGTVPAFELPPLRANALQIAGPLQLQFWPDNGRRIRAVAATPMQISARALTINTGTPWQLKAPALTWLGQVAAVEHGADWTLTEADVSLHGTGLTATVPTLQIHLKDWQSRWRFTDDRWQGHWQSRHAELQRGDERYASTPLAITVHRLDRHGRAEFDINAKALSSTALSGWPQPELRASATLQPPSLRFRGSLRQRDNALLQFTGRHDLDRAQGQATLGWQLDLAELDRLLQPRPTALTALGPGSGRSDGKLNLQWDLTPTPMALGLNGQLQLTDANLQWQEASAKQINAALDLQQLAPLQGRLSVNVPAATLAVGLSATDNQLQLELGPELLKLERFSSHLLGGSWQANDDSMPRAPSPKSLPIAVNGLALAPILALVDLDGLSGEGTLDGVLPLVQEAAGLAVREGSLQSRAPGVLRYAPASIAMDNPGLQALRDFHYQQLRVQLDYHADGSYLIQLKLDGNNPAFYYGFPIALTLNLKGQLPGLLRAAVLSGDFNAHVLEQLQSGTLQ